MKLILSILVAVLFVVSVTEFVWVWSVNSKYADLLDERNALAVEAAELKNYIFMQKERFSNV